MGNNFAKLSMIDLLFNKGPESSNYISENFIIES